MDDIVSYDVILREKFRLQTGVKKKLFARWNHTQKYPKYPGLGARCRESWYTHLL